MSLSDYYTQTVKIVTVTSPDDFSTGDFSESCATEKAAINPSRGSERFAGGKNETFAGYKMFVSSTVSVAESQRVVWEGKALNVEFVKNTLAKDHHKLVMLSEDVR